MLTADWEIESSNIVIEGFQPQAVRPGVLSFGVSSYGYDIRLGYHFKVCRDPMSVLMDNKRRSDALPPEERGAIPLGGLVLDPKNFDVSLFRDVTVAPGGYIEIPPNSFALAESIEVLAIPRNTLAVCVGKSTYARLGVIVNVTPLEPEWRGAITIEISNTTPFLARLYPGEGIMQVLFFKTTGRTCDVSYADKKGRYQNQTGITLPSVPAGIKAYWDQGVPEGVSEGDRTVLQLIQEDKTTVNMPASRHSVNFSRGEVDFGVIETPLMPDQAKAMLGVFAPGVLKTFDGAKPPEPMAFPPVPVDDDDID